MGLVALFSGVTELVQVTPGNLTFFHLHCIWQSLALVFLPQSKEACGRCSCVFYVIVDPDPKVGSPFALENLDITSTRPLYLAVIAPDSSVLEAFEEFQAFST